MRKIALLFVAAILITLLHSCNMDNNVIKPNCRIVESDLVEKHWVATTDVKSTEASEIIFSANGNVEYPHIQFQPHEVSKTFLLHFCNKIEVVDDATNTIDEWTIRELSSTYMRLRYGDNNEVEYERK